MKRNIKLLSLDLIKLDQENVRFGGDVANSQREAIELLMADPIDAKKILKLTEHISKNGLDPTELQLVMPNKNGEYVVLEGNRRLTALKLLQKPDLCPDEKLVKSFVTIQSEMKENVLSEVECSVVQSRAEGDMWLEIKHTGENGGVGRVGWDPDIRDERRARQTGIESVGRQVRKIVEENSLYFDKESLRGVKNIHVTTLTRLFSSRPAQELLGLKVDNKTVVPQYETRFIAPSIEFVIRMFIDHGYNVNDVRSDSDRKKFLSHVPPEIIPEKLFWESNKKNTTKIPGLPNSAAESGADVVSDFENQTNSNEDNIREKPSSSADESNSDQPKIRAKPSSKARKFLVPWSLSISNSRVNEVYRELRAKLEVEKVVNATAITFRVFLELTCDELTRKIKENNGELLRADNARPLTKDASLSIKICACANYLKNENLITNGECKAISKRASGQNTIGSVDHLNQFVHDSCSPPLASELKDIADEYRPLLQAIWR